MTLSTRQKRKAVQILDSIIEKCGGPGGKPGPCPMGNKPKPSGGAGGGRKPRASSKPTGGKPTGGKPSKDPKVAVKKAALRAMPAGTKKDYREDGKESYSWSKRGGYAGERSIKKTIAKMEKLGFKRRESDNTSSAGPTGVVGRGDIWDHPDGHTFSHHSSYGSTASSNSFGMRLTFAS